jgi:hypothetical protein
MAQSTELAGFIVPSEFTSYVMEQSNIKNALVRSGIVLADPLVSGALAKGGGVATVLTYKNIDVTSSANVTSSNQGSSATPKLVTGRGQKFARVGRNDAWSAADWDASMLGSDPAAYVGGEVSNAVAKWRQTSLLSVLAGATGASSGNLVDITAADDDAAVISASTIIDARASTWSDLDTGVTAIFMHPLTLAKLQKEEYTSFARSPFNGVELLTYLQMPVFTDATLPVNTGAYTSYLVKAGGLRFGTNTPKHATEVSRSALVGNGGGADILSFRDEFAYHIPGMSFTGSISGDNVTDAELATTGNWTKIYDNKSIGVLAFKHLLVAAE